MSVKNLANCHATAQKLLVRQVLNQVSDLIFSRPRSEGWPHYGHTFSICPCPLLFWLTLPRRVLSTSWCCHADWLQGTVCVWLTSVLIGCRALFVYDWHPCWLVAGHCSYMIDIRADWLQGTVYVWLTSVLIGCRALFVYDWHPWWLVAGHCSCISAQRTWANWTLTVWRLDHHMSCLSVWVNTRRLMHACLKHSASEWRSLLYKFWTEWSFIYAVLQKIVYRPIFNDNFNCSCLIAKKFLGQLLLSEYAIEWWFNFTHFTFMYLTLGNFKTPKIVSLTSNWSYSQF